MDEPIAANFAKADLDRADLVAADGPHLAEIVEPVVAQPREKIANSRAEQPRESAPSPQKTTTADTSLAETRPYVAPSKDPLAKDSPANDAPSNDPPPSNSPTTESRLAARPHGHCNCPTCRRLKPTTVQPTRMPRSRIPRRESAPAAGANRWTPPVDLLRRLESLGHASECSHWAVRQRPGARVDRAGAARHAGAKEIVGDLRAMTGSAEALLVTIQQRDVAIELLRVRHALSRRLDVWELLPALQSTGESAADAARRDPTRLSMCLADVAVLTREGGSEGNRWRNYLLLETLESVAQAGQRGSEDEARDVAQRVLRRLSRGGLTGWQRDFLTSGPLAQLGDELRGWAAEPVDACQLLADLEQFEQTGLPGDAPARRASASTVVARARSSRQVGGPGRNALSQRQSAGGDRRVVSRSTGAAVAHGDHAGQRPRPRLSRAGHEHDVDDARRSVGARSTPTAAGPGSQR